MIIIKTSSDDQDTLEKISNILLKQKLAGCITIIPNCISFFSWENKVQKSKESLMLVKTIKVNEKIIFKKIKELHNYKTPEIITFKVESLDSDYSKWLNEVVEQND